MNKSVKIFVAGHKGMVGSGLVRFLTNQNVKVITKEKSDLNLLNQTDVYDFFKSESIDQIYLAAAKVGGIHANNSFPADFIYENLMIQNNVIHGAFLNNIKKLLFLGSSCIYPRNANQPIQEEELLNGKLEKTNEPYAISKIAGIKMCESYNRQYGKSHNIDFRCIMPTNLYGPGDNYHPQNSHVIPGLINRFHKAKINNLPTVSIWGSGRPKRDFLYVDDMIRASIYIMNLDKKIYDKNISEITSHVNIGSSEEISIKDLALIIKKVIGFKGEIKFDNAKPDGTPRKLLDSSLINKIGFQPKVSLVDGIKITYQEYIR
tara:strand:- start:9573 stop:10529 length:957 start_codon:yes stop_codon:yes gene_type:complete